MEHQVSNVNTYYVRIIFTNKANERIDNIY